MHACQIKAEEENMLERRRLRRRHLIYYLRVFDRNNDALIGHLIDITSEGAMLISEDPIETNTIFQSRMVLPEEKQGSREITFDARSVWCKKDINPDYYATGFQLLNAAPQDVEVIEWLIEKFGFRD